MFRKAVLEHRQGSQFGELLVLPQASITISTVLLTVIVVCALVFLSINDYERKQQVSGFLAPDKGLVKVYAPRTGFVKEILIGKGEQVSAGQIVAVVQGQLSDEQGRLTNVQLIEELKIQQKHLQAEIDNLAQLSEMERSRLSLGLNGQRAQLKVLKRRLNIEVEKHQLARQSHANKMQIKDKQFLSSNAINQSEQNLLSMAAAIEQIKLQIAEHESELSANELALKQIEPKSIEQKLALQMRHSELSQRIIQAQSAHSYTIKAPIAGTVSSLQIVEGNSIGTLMPLLSIIPQDAVLEGKLLVPSSAIGFMTAGQTVRLRYDAFPYQRYGAYLGEVIHISRNTLSGAELAQSIGMTEKLSTTTEAVYLVDVKLVESAVTAYGRSIDLQVGMSFSADVILETRSLIQWLLDPLYSITGRL